MADINMNKSKSAEASSSDPPQQTPKPSNQAAFEDLWSSVLDDSPPASQNSSPAHNNNHHNNHNQRRKKKFKKIRLPGGPIMSDSALNHAEKIMLDRAIRKSLKRGSSSSSGNFGAHVRNHHNNAASSRNSHQGSTRRSTAPATSPIPKSEQSTSNGTRSQPTASESLRQKQSSPLKETSFSSSNSTGHVASSCTQPHASSLNISLAAEQTSQSPHSKNVSQSSPSTSSPIPSQTPVRKSSPHMMPNSTSGQTPPVPQITLPPGFASIPQTSAFTGSPSPSHTPSPKTSPQMIPSTKSGQNPSVPLMPNSTSGQNPSLPQIALPPGFEYMPESQKKLFYEYQQQQMRNHRHVSPVTAQAVSPIKQSAMSVGHQGDQQRQLPDNQGIPSQQLRRSKDETMIKAMQPQSSQFEAQSKAHQQSSHALIGSQNAPVSWAVQPQSSQFGTQSNLRQHQTQVRSQEATQSHVVQPQSSQFSAQCSPPQQSSCVRSQAVQPQSSHFGAQQQQSCVSSQGHVKTQGVQPQSCQFGVHSSTHQQLLPEPHKALLTQAIQPQSSTQSGVQHQQACVSSHKHVKTQAVQPQSSQFGEQSSVPHQPARLSSHEHVKTQAVQPQSSQFGEQSQVLHQPAHLSSHEASQTQAVQPQSAQFGTQHQPGLQSQPQYSQQQLLHQQQVMTNQRSMQPHISQPLVPQPQTQSASSQYGNVVEKRKYEDQGEENVATKRQKNEDQPIDCDEAKEEAEIAQPAEYHVGGENNLVVHAPKGCTFNIYQNRSEHSSNGGGDDNGRGACNGGCSANNSGSASPAKTANGKQHAIQWAGATTETDSGPQGESSAPNIPIPMFREMAKSIGRKWKFLARQLPMVEYSLLETELKILDECSGNDTDKSLAVLTKWWRENPDNWDAAKMKCQLEDALRECHLVRLARNIDDAFRALSV